MRVHEKNHHVWKKVRVGRARPGLASSTWCGESADLIRPIPSG